MSTPRATRNWLFAIGGMAGIAITALTLGFVVLADDASGGDPAAEPRKAPPPTTMPCRASTARTSGSDSRIRSTGMAKAMLSACNFLVVFRPTISPETFRSGPPLEPGFVVASVWIMSG